MIRAYVRDGAQIRARDTGPDEIPGEALWLDLRDPTREEEMAVEALVKAEIPTREDMGEIEVSSRLYSSDNADYMTLILPHDVGDGRKEFSPVTFILAGERLVTVRYCDPRSFAIFIGKLCRPAPPGTSAADALREKLSLPLNGGGGGNPNGSNILVGLIETIVDRLADLLEGVAGDLDAISGDIFRSSRGRKPIATSAFKLLLRRIGEAGELISHLRESLASVDRMLPFFQLTLDKNAATKSARPRIKAIGRDVQSLNDFVSFLSNKTSFLLDTTVGMISIEQNGIIKIFSVASVGFMPPTLVASIYGMNFRNMPELDWRFGYPMALGIMVLSAVLPLIFFRLKRWL